MVLPTESRMFLILLVGSNLLALVNSQAREENGTAVDSLVINTPSAPSAPPASVRLTNGDTSDTVQTGRLEVFYNGSWGTVCDDRFGNTDARVACSSLGFSCRSDACRIGLRPQAESQCDRPSTNVKFTSDGKRILNGRVGWWYLKAIKGNNSWEGKVIPSRPFRGATCGTTIWLDNVECTGDETSILDCRHAGWGRHDCSHTEDVGLHCFNPLSASVRLTNGEKSTNVETGRLEVFYKGVWGTVCGEGFNDTDILVTCSSLGFREGRVIPAGPFSETSPPNTIWLDDVECSGNETSIFDCKHAEWGEHNCTHTEDVGLHCFSPIPAPVRLANGEEADNAQTGRLEVYHNGMWGAVCDHGFGETNARVACSSLGFRDGRAILSSGRFSRPSRATTIWLDNVECTGNETSISTCSHAGWGEHDCQSDEAVGLHCFNPIPAITAMETTAGSRFGCESGVIQSRYCIWHFTKDCFNRPVTAQFALNFKTPPAANIGYIMLDLDKNHNARVATSTNIAHMNGPAVTRTSITVQFHCWGDSECYRVALSYMACGELNN